MSDLATTFDPNLWTAAMILKLSAPGVTFVDKIEEPVDGEYFAFVVENPESIQSQANGGNTVPIYRYTGRVIVALLNCLEERMKRYGPVIAAFNEIELIETQTQGMIVRGLLAIAPADHAAISHAVPQLT